MDTMDKRMSQFKKNVLGKRNDYLYKDGKYKKRSHEELYGNIRGEDNKALG